MDWREFLMPGWRKLLFFVFLAVAGLLFSFPLGVLEHRSAACPPDLYERGMMPDCMEVVIIYPNVLLNLSIYYLLSCLLVYGWDRSMKK